ncbi:MAG TPA: hypothetical protein VG324_15140 [Blastocatellia bacterium]|nr:hypothetical protein [Blastocatellia bacterium]
MQKRMKLASALSIVLAGSSAWTLSQDRSLSAPYEEPQKNPSATIMNTQPNQNEGRQIKAAQESPFACNMLALDAEGRKRHKAVSERMRAAVKEVQELSDGYAFRFPAEQANILLVSEFIARERLCCPFFRFELIAEQEDGPLWLRLRGREGVKEFIKAELGIK